MKKCLCFETTMAGYRIALEQESSRLFTVTYGEQVEKHLRYTDAANALGASIMHAACLEGRLEGPRGENM